MKHIAAMFCLVSVIIFNAWTASGAGIWEEKFPGGSIGNRVRYSMAFDATRYRTYVYGGAFLSRPYATAMWYYDGMDWIMETPAADIPGRNFPALVYVASVDKLFMFGGSDPNFLNESWYFTVMPSPDPPEWSIVDVSLCTELPAGRHAHGMVYDPDRNMVIVFGGVGTGSNYYNDIWTFDPSVDPAAACPWALITPAKNADGKRAVPAQRAYHGMVYDLTRQLVVIYGGRNGSGRLDDTWEYNPATQSFSELICGIYKPGFLDRFAMSYDAAMQTVVLFGGESSSISDQTWELEESIPAWYQTSVSTHPSSRSEMAMAYDATRQCHVLFGGKDSSANYLSDTWEYRIFATPSPTATPYPVPATTPAGHITLLIVFGIILTLMIAHPMRS